MAAAAHKDAAVAKLAAGKLVLLAPESGQHPFAQQIITIQAKEAEALAAKAAGNDEAIAKMKEAVAIEDSIDSLSQPPYPVLPANELFGTLLMELNRPADAKEQEARERMGIVTTAQSVNSRSKRGTFTEEGLLPPLHPHELVNEAFSIWLPI
jgi:hypothetical protein